MALATIKNLKQSSLMSVGVTTQSTATNMTISPDQSVLTRSRVADKHLQATMKLVSSQAVTPNIDSLVDSERCQLNVNRDGVSLKTPRPRGWVAQTKS